MAAGASSIAVQFGTTGSIVWSDVLKTSIVAAATAGIVNANLFDGKSLNELAGMTQSASGSEAVRGFSYSGDNLVGIVGRNTVSAGLSAVVQGGSFADGFVRGMIGDFGAQGAKDIGTLWGNGKDPVLQTLAHMGLGGMIAGAQGDDVIAGVIGGGVESVYSNIAGKPLAGSTLGDIAYISGAMFVGGFASQLAGHDPSVAATIAQNAAQNNYLYHHEAQELQEAEDQLRRCKDDTCRSQYQSTITELKNRDELRNQLLDNACHNPSSPECRRAYDDVRKAADSYAGTNYSGLLNVLGRESQEAQSKADMYGLRTQNPEGYNATTALVESVLAGTVSTFELATLAVLAGTGDPIAQQKLSAIAGSVGEFIAHPIDTTEQAIKQKLDQANQLEAQGRIDEAQRIRYGLIADGTLVLTGAGAVAAHSGRELVSFGKKTTGSDIPLNNGGTPIGPPLTGTVWDWITPTQPVYPGSVIPKSFEMSLPNGKSVWVHGNATEHIAEYAKMKAENYTPEAVRLASQVQLSSLQAAINTATQNGLKYDKLITVGEWELKFSPPRIKDGQPALIHALMKNSK